jgi:uncharacterized protein YndB with AHSA1/START domain
MSGKQQSPGAGAAESTIVIERTYRATPDELWALWTTKDGFESWWGPEGFRADVHAIEARAGGKLHYDMVADSPEMIEAMKQMGRPASHETRGWFAEYSPHRRLVLMHMIDFLPGVTPYESTIEVDFLPLPAGTRMVVTLHPMHNQDFSSQQAMGFTSQLTKLDRRFATP